MFGPLAHESYTYENGWVSEDGDRMFNVGAVRDTQELRAVICAYRIGCNHGEKTGRTLQQYDIAKAMGLPISVLAKES